jgi:hypothetical protein
MKRTSILSSAALAATSLQREAGPVPAAAPAQGLPHMPAAVRNALASQSREVAPVTQVPVAPLQTREDPAAPAAAGDAAPAPAAGASPTSVQAATGQVAEGADGGWTVNLVLELRSQAESFGAHVAKAAEAAMRQSGATEASVRAAILTAAASAQRAQTGSGSSARVIVDERDTFRQRAMDGLVLRARPNLSKGMDDKRLGAARDFRGMSFERLAEECLQFSNATTRGLTRAELIRSALSTTDFPQLLSGALGRSLQAAYEGVPVIYDQFCQRKTITDFRVQTAIGLSGFGEMRVVPEGGEAKRKDMNEYPEQYKLAKMEEILSITFEALVNDDLGAFQGTSDRLALMGRTSERRAVYQLFGANGPVMADGLTLFHANHRNLITTSPGAPTVTRLGAIRQTMRKQTDQPAGTGTGGTSLNLGLQFVLAPTQHETTLDQLFAGVATGLQGDGAAIARSDLLLGNLKSVIPIVDPMLDDYSATNWFGLPAKEYGAVGYGYLEGEDGLVVEELPPGLVSGIQLKARLAFAAFALDWRGPVMHTG